MTDEPRSTERLEAEIRDLLAALGVQPRDLDPRPGESRRAERDLAAILTTTPRTDEAQSAVSGRRRVVRVACLLATAAAVALALVIVRPFTGSAPVMAATPAVLHLQDAGKHLQGGSASKAPREFRKLARLAASQPPVPNGPVQRTILNSWLLSTDEKSGKAPARSVLTPVISDRYYLPDGTFRAVDHRGSALDTEGRVVDSLKSMKDEPPSTDETFDGPEEGPDYADELPTEPRALLSRLVDPRECPHATASCLVSKVTFLHYSYVLRPSTTAALWFALAETPGFKFLGETRDRLDRPSVAFVTSGSDSTTRRILLADPATGALLGSEEILVKDSASLGLKAPAVTEFIALAQSSRITSDQVPDSGRTTVY